MGATSLRGVRKLVLVLGDQLNLDNPALDDFDLNADRVLMIEAPGEAAHVWSHKSRIALFLSAMRHFRDALRERGVDVEYIALGDSDAPTLVGRLAEQLHRLRPETLSLIEPGEWRLEQTVTDTARAAGVACRVLDDTHFMCSRADFARWAGKYASSLRMEFFYREMRRKHGVLIDLSAVKPGEPEGGQWNFDADNRNGYPKTGPGLIPLPARFTSKPYVASGAYIHRMSNHCGGCAYAPDAKSAQSSGRPLCPFTVLYWNFLDRHETLLAANPRTALMAKNLARLPAEGRLRIRDDAQRVLQSLEAL